MNALSPSGEGRPLRADFLCLICSRELYLLPTPLLCCGKSVCADCMRIGRFGSSCPGCGDSVIMRSAGTSQHIYEIFAQKARAGIAWAARGCAKVWDQRLADGEVDAEICKKQSFNWYSVAIRLGDVESIGYLAAAYKEGNGCRQSNEKALELYITCANQGRKNTQCFLGVCFHRGYMVQKSVKTALYWYKRSLADETQPTHFPSRLYPPALREDVEALVRKWTTCAKCNDFDGEKYICGQCESVCYCDEKCQAEHWELHKTECTNIKKMTLLRMNVNPLAN